MKTQFACGSVVLVYLFHQNVTLCATFWWKKRIFRPARSEIPFRVNDCV